MSNTKIFTDAEIPFYQDFQDIGDFSQASIDEVVRDAVGYRSHWAAFTASLSSASVVTIGQGTYFKGAYVYNNDADIDVNLQTFMPAAASDERWIALILRSQEEVVSHKIFSETFIDPETQQVVELSSPKIKKRSLYVTEQLGVARPAPAEKPMVDEADACIAFVLLKSTGIEKIEVNNDDRVKSLAEVEGRVVILERDLSSLFLKTASLESDLSNIAAQVKEIPQSAIIEQMQQDISAHDQLLGRPKNARAYIFEPGLLHDNWDNTHAQYHARIDEGVRFPYAQEQVAQMGVLNEDDPLVRFNDRRLTPAFDEVVKIENWGGTTSKNISQTEHAQIELIKREVSREKIEYGPTIKVCENTRHWSQYKSLRAGSTFTHNGEEFEALGVVAAHNSVGHRRFGFRKITRQTVVDTYWDEKHSTIGVNGSIVGQGMLVSQAMIATGISLEFSKVGADGNVHLYLCETNSAGLPDYKAVVAESQIDHANLVLGENKFDMDITLLDAGKRYYWFAVTTGNHSLFGTNDNSYAGGTSVTTTDGAVAVGDLLFDYNFKLWGAKFKSVRTEIQFLELTLPDGMTEIDLLYASWCPEPCEMIWQVKPSGAPDWITLDDAEDNALVGLPALCQLKLIMIGTADLSPMIVMDQFARATTARNADAMRGVTNSFDLGVTTSTIITQYVVDAFDATAHVFEPRIIVNDGTNDVTIVPNIDELTIDPTNPEKRTYRSTYDLSATPVTHVRMAPHATTNNVVNVPFIDSAFVTAL